MIFIYGFILFVLFWFLVRMRPRVKKHGVFNLYFGSPGSGKTTFLTSDCMAYHKIGFPVYSNYALPFAFKFTKDDIGTYQFPPDSVLLFDEGSLNGFDNREYSKNFKDSNKLSYLKLLRHYRNRMIFSNQGFDELDKKIRTLTVCYWLVRKVGPFAFATRIFKRVIVDDITHQIIDGYFFPRTLSLLFRPSVTRIVRIRKYTDYFDSFEAPQLPLIENVAWIPESFNHNPERK